MQFDTNSLNSQPGHSVALIMFSCHCDQVGRNKENNVFKDGIGVKGLRFKLHGNNHGNHG